MKIMNSEITLEDQVAIKGLARIYDLSEGVMLRHSLYIPDKFKADKLARQLRRSGFATAVVVSSYKDYYLLVVDRWVDDIEKEIPRLRTDFTNFSSQLSGEYGGWQLLNSEE